MKKLNGWCSRCLAPITGKTPHEEASARKQTMCVTGIIRYRRLIYLGHVLRDDPGSLPRRALLRYAELERRGVVDEPGDILMDAPASNTNGQLVEMAGGFGSTENRETRRAEWKAMCKRRLSDADRSRVNRKEDLLADIRACVTANTAEETAAALSEIEHKWHLSIAIDVWIRRTRSGGSFLPGSSTSTLTPSCRQRKCPAIGSHASYYVLSRLP